MGVTPDLVLSRGGDCTDADDRVARRQSAQRYPLASGSTAGEQKVIDGYQHFITAGAAFCVISGARRAWIGTVLLVEAARWRAFLERIRRASVADDCHFVCAVYERCWCQVATDP